MDDSQIILTADGKAKIAELLGNVKLCLVFDIDEFVFKPGCSIDLVYKDGKKSWFANYDSFCLLDPLTHTPIVRDSYEDENSLIDLIEKINLARIRSLNDIQPILKRLVPQHFNDKEVKVNFWITI